MLLIDPTGKKTYLFATDLPGGHISHKIATHTFIYVDNPAVVNDMQKKLKTEEDLSYFAYGSSLSGFIGMGVGQLGRRIYTDDLATIEKHQEGKTDSRVAMKIEVPVPYGMTEDEFDQSIISTAMSYGNNPEMQYFMIPLVNLTGNCNSSTSTILLKAGVPENEIGSIKKKLPPTAIGFSTEPKLWTKEEQDKANTILKRLAKDCLLFNISSSIIGD